MNTSEVDFAKVMAPKVIGTRVLHDTFKDHDLEFFVMFGSAGSTIASPGQGNYAAANAFLDAFAHYRQAQGLPALTIGWGPWSVGMVEELKLEKIYAQRGIELITPAVGARILDRLINQKTPSVVAISADWSRARQAGFGGRLPLMFSDLGTIRNMSLQKPIPMASILAVLAATPEVDRPAVIADHVKHIVAAVFDCAVDDFEPDDMLEDIGLDSMMAMDFRVRINMVFSIDLPVLEILRGVSVNSLSDRVLAELHSIHGDVPAASRRFVATAVHCRRRRRGPADGRTVGCRSARAAGRTGGTGRDRSGRGTLVTCSPCTNRSSAVSVRGLSKAYGRLHAVRDLDLDVGYGEIFAILGPNGAGKSTTIEILEGHRKRDAGQVRVLGEDPGDCGAELARQDRHRAAGDQRLRDAHGTGNRAHVREVLRRGSSPRGATRTRRARLEFRFEGQDALWGTATPARRRPRHHRQARTALPGRTDHGFRSRSETTVLGSHQGLGRRRHHHLCSPLTTWRRPPLWPTASRSSPVAGWPRWIRRHD